MAVTSLLYCLLFLFVNLEQGKCDDISPEDYPFHAIFKGRIWCVGALINVNYVIAPARCVKGATDINVTLGSKGNPKFTSVSDEDGVQTIPSSQIIIRDDYYQVGEYLDVNDVALIKLSTPAVLTKTVQPVKIASSDIVNTLYTQMVDVTGWRGNGEGPLTLEKVKLETFDTCTYLFKRQVFDQNLCVSSNEAIQDLFYGDLIGTNGLIFALRLASPDVQQRFDDKRYKLGVNLNFFLGWITRETNISTSDLVASEIDSETTTTTADPTTTAAPTSKADCLRIVTFLTSLPKSARDCLLKILMSTKLNAGVSASIYGKNQIIQ